LVSTIENLDVKPEALAQLTPFVHCHESEEVSVQFRLLFPINLLQLGPAQFIVMEKLESASQNIKVPLVVVVMVAGNGMFSRQGSNLIDM
jgi:hypothetical protein